MTPIKTSKLPMNPNEFDCITKLQNVRQVASNQYLNS